MKNISNIAVKTGFSLLIFIVFMILLSPVYIYRSVQVKVSYSSSAKAELDIVPTRNLADALTQRVKQQSHYSLDAAEHSSCVYLEVPCDNRMGCLSFCFQKLPSHFKIHEITVSNGRKKYQVELSKVVAEPQNVRFVTVKDNQLHVKSNRKISIAFPMKKLLRINRNIDPVLAIYMMLLSLLPAILVYYKTEVDMKGRSWLYVLYSAAALIMLVIPVLLIDYYSILSRENRMMNPFPKLLIHRRFNSDFPQQFEKWFSDRFTGRKMLITNEKVVFSPNFIGDFSYTKNAIVCKNGWLFTRQFSSEDMFKNKNRFTSEQLEICAENLKSLNRYFKQQNIRLYVMMAPDKDRVYSEFYPSRYKQVHPESRLEQLYKYLSEKTDVKIIFPLHELRKMKNKYRVYSKIGTHWTPRGAYIAFMMLHQEMKKDFPGLPSEQPNASVWKTAYSADCDIARIAGFTNPEKQFPSDSLFQEIPQRKCAYKQHIMNELSVDDIRASEYLAENPEKNGVKVFAFTDSFWEAIIPFMFPCTNQMIHIFWGNGLPFNINSFTSILSQQHPDIVVIETTERFLDRFLTLTIDGD